MSFPIALSYLRGFCFCRCFCFSPKKIFVACPAVSAEESPLRLRVSVVIFGFWLWLRYEDLQVLLAFFSFPNQNFRCKLTRAFYEICTDLSGPGPALGCCMQMTI